jgi:hypothetical protein
MEGSMDKDNGQDDSREFLYLAGGLALMVLGAGLIVAHPAVRRNLMSRLEGFIPDVKDRLSKLTSITDVGSDIQRYMKLRAM